jgi:hypothetical protein
LQKPVTFALALAVFRPTGCKTEVLQQPLSLWEKPPVRALSLTACNADRRVVNFAAWQSYYGQIIRSCPKKKGASYEKKKHGTGSAGGVGAWFYRGGLFDIPYIKVDGP